MPTGTVYEPQIKQSDRSAKIDNGSTRIDYVENEQYLQSGNLLKRISFCVKHVEGKL